MIDLAALRSLLIARGSPLSLAASDATLPAELRALLTGVPDATLRLSAGADGIRLDGDTLTITGASSDAWPVQGFTGVTVSLATATITVTNAAGTSTVTGGATGSMPVAAGQVAVALASATVSEHPAWTLTLAGPTSGLRASDLLALGQGGRSVAPPVPDGLDVLDTAVSVDPAGFVVTFFPNTTFDPWFTVRLTVPGARWTVLDGVLELDGLDVSMFLEPGGSSVALTGHLTIEGIGVDISTTLADIPQWTIDVRPSSGTAFPGLVALAGWLGGRAGGQVTGAFQRVGFDLPAFDLAIASVRISYDWSTRSLAYAEIVSLLTIKALRLDLAVRLPNLTVYGGLHGGQPVNLASVLASFGLPTGGVPAQLTLSEADFSAQPALGMFSIDLILDDVWAIGPLDVTEVALLVNRDQSGTFTGYVNGFLTFGTSIELQLTAEYGGAEAGWTFTGSTGASTLDIGDLIAGLASTFGVTEVPGALRSLSLHDVMLQYQTGTGAFTFTCVGTFAVADQPVSLSIDVQLTPGPSDATPAPSRPPRGRAEAQAYEVVFRGRLTIGSLVFDVVFDREQDGADIFVATYHQQGSANVNLHDLIAKVSPAAAEAVPAELSIGLTDVKFLYAKAAGATDAAFALGLDLSAHVGLSQLPLIGDQLPADAALAINELQLLYSKAAIDKTTIAVANRLLDTGVIAFPAAGLDAGVALTADLQIGSDRQAISFGVPSATSAPPRAGRPRPHPVPAVPGADAPAQGVGRWFLVQRTIGVLTINRVGILYQHNAVLFALDAEIQFGPLQLSLNGLGLGSTLSAFQPVFNLDGLGLAYAEGPLEITGALLRVPDSALAPGVTLQYDGSALVQAESFGLAAIASWARTQSGQPSLFVFAEYDEPLGGPPALFVTGLMAGFGYNRALALPAQDEVGSFPLLLLNQPGSGGTPPSADKVLAVLEGQQPAIHGGPVRQWIAPNPGSDWLAVGIVFTSFELVHSRALLVAEFGNELAFALLGTSTIQLPMPGDSAETYAYVELDLEAVLKPAEGFFGLTAILAPTSYVLTKACHLTGGFAMYTWFGDSPYAGQFVVTLGGYHPAFVPPPYYPSVPRLGFNWAVSDAVSISGSAYLAITPSCAMAGGALDVEFHDGDLRAWFTAHADVLISWRPFFFTADIGISIGVSYRLFLLFCYKTISLSLGASVRLWGPPTGGQVHVDLWIISFTVSFGAPPPDTADKPLGWGEFSGMLPATASTVTVAPVSGLMSMIPSTVSTSGKAWLMRARDLRFSTQSAVPASRLRYGDTPDGAPPDQQNFDGDPVHVRPMNLASVQGVHRLTVRQGATTAPLTGWTLAPRTASTPDSLWGKPPVPFTQVPAAPSAAVLPDQFVGYDVTAQPPVTGPSRGVFPIAELAQTELPPGGLPLVPNPVPDTAFRPVPGTTTVGLIEGIAAAAPARTVLRDALAAIGAYDGEAGTLDRLAANAQHLFSDSPMVAG